MLNDSLTTTHKCDNIHNKINTDGKKLMKDEDILNRMLRNSKNFFKIFIYLFFFFFFFLVFQSAST